MATAISHVLRNCLFLGNAFNQGLSGRDIRFVKLTAKLLCDGFQIWEMIDVLEALARLCWWLHNAILENSSVNSISIQRWSKIREGGLVIHL